ncbi:uncharacterized protein F5147DRAFT_784716 [Suillus discolor]|uniref:Uncharacterized protein n=1 Tax=Suillus discolor TaxID=1912936 RepID=A0A9P7ER03_9AGAM|nr:uncharacterized protein F5147DRAFT_784716 [Suillus discolor]KAG2079843.1 hypothetical protein F5147DRAFT_784716 [Suillus discolor]
MDGKYDYHEAYYRIIRAIPRAIRSDMGGFITEWWNMRVYWSLTLAIDDDKEEDDLISMRKQFASRAAEARLKSISSDAQGSTLPSDPGSDTSVINTTSTPPLHRLP